MQTPDNLSLSSGATGLSGGPGYQRLRTDTEDHAIPRNDSEGKIASQNGHQLVVDRHPSEDDEDDMQEGRALSPSSSTLETSSLVMENDEEPTPTTAAPRALFSRGNSADYHRANSSSSDLVATVAATVAAAAKSSADGYQKVMTQLEQSAALPAPSTLRSRSNSWDAENDDEDFGDHQVPSSSNGTGTKTSNGMMNLSGGGDLFDDDDEEVVRRYVRNRIPIVPAEFDQPFYRRVWHAFGELRTAARQRRAARLLNNDSRTNSALTHCVLTWCCDATDRGIALVAILMLLWLVIGWTTSRGDHIAGYWLIGCLVFGVRISARRLYECCIISRTRRKRAAAAGSVTTSATSSPTSSPASTATLELSKDYRDHA